MKDYSKTHAEPGATTIEPSGATDDIRYVLNRQPAASQKQHGATADSDVAACGDVATSAQLPADQPAEHLAGAGGLADSVIDNVDGQLPDTSTSTVRGGKVGQESKRGAY